MPLLMTPRALAEDVRCIQRHVLRNYNFDYGPRDSLAGETARRLDHADPEALADCIRWVLFVSRWNTAPPDGRALDAREQEAFRAAQRLNVVLDQIDEKTLRRAMSA